MIIGLNNNPVKATPKKGFTLLELLVVMVLIAILMAITVPSLGLFTSSRPILNLSAQFVALTDYARSQSISEGRSYRLNIDSEKGSFWLTAQVNGNFERLEKEIGREFLLAEGIEIELLDVSSPAEVVMVPGLWLPGQLNLGNTSEANSNENIAFYPDGHIQPAAFRLTDKRGNALDIVCSSPSDRFRIISTEEDK